MCHVNKDFILQKKIRILAKRAGSASAFIDLESIPHCLMWCLWREQNIRSFEGTELSILDLKLLFFQTLYEWIVAL